ncbi:MAG: hypothetical protein HQ596_02825, partial [Candidatus Saganbacteria bacterium]|nr:hypothetical protein [Candidatus Saganbacteria bacterium]
SSTATNLCAGAGINLRGFQLDLAYRQDATLSNNSNFYLSLSYAPYIENAVAEVPQEPETNSAVESQKVQPKPEKPVKEYQNISDYEKSVLGTTSEDKNQDNPSKSFDYYDTISRK